MKTLTSSAVALALVACGTNKQPSPTAGQEPKQEVVAKAKDPAPAASTPTAPTPPTATFAAVVNSAPSTTEERVDASSLGTRVEAYLITRYGAPGTHDDMQGQQVDLGLVLVGGGKAIRVELGTYESAVLTVGPLGELSAAPPFGGRTYDPEADAFFSAPKWKDQAPIVLADSVHDVSGDTVAFVVTHDQDSLFVWYAENVWEEGASKTWDRDTKIALANGATVTAPVPATDTPVIYDPLTVRLVDRVASESQGYRWYDVSLQIGDRVGPVAQRKAKISEDAAWVIEASTDGLPDRLPTADAFFAHRTYRESAGMFDTMLLGRVDDELVLWTHSYYDGAGEWLETASFELPAGAKLDVR